MLAKLEAPGPRYTRAEKAEGPGLGDRGLQGKTRELS
jgi:hypothetical protein